MIRSDGGTETRRYYKGGNTFSAPRRRLQRLPGYWRRSGQSS